MTLIKNPRNVIHLQQRPSTNPGADATCRLKVAYRSNMRRMTGEFHASPTFAAMGGTAQIVTGPSP